MEADDRPYLEKLLAPRAGLTAEDAKARVDAVPKRAEEAAQQAQQAAETARKAGATFALVGVFIASAAAALGGPARRQRRRPRLPLVNAPGTPVRPAFPVTRTADHSLDQTARNRWTLCSADVATAI
jgi:hypothetical protein